MPHISFLDSTPLFGQPESSIQKARKLPKAEEREAKIETYRTRKRERNKLFVSKFANLTKVLRVLPLLTFAIFNHDRLEVPTAFIFHRFFSQDLMH